MGWGGSPQSSGVRTSFLEWVGFNFLSKQVTAGLGRVVRQLLREQQKLRGHGPQPCSGDVGHVSGAHGRRQDVCLEKWGRQLIKCPQRKALKCEDEGFRLDRQLRLVLEVSLSQMLRSCCNALESMEETRKVLPPDTNV